jgi:ABC-type Fe3+-siderophore transport system permease subunit
VVKIKINLEKTAQIMAIVLGLFGLFIAYQIIKYLLGGSWDKEDLLLSLVGINIGITFTGVVYVALMKGDLKFMSYRLKSLDSAFRAHIKEENK